MPAPIRGRSRPHATPYRSSSTLILAVAALALAAVALAGCDDGGPLSAPKSAATASRVALQASRAAEVIPDQYIVDFRDSVRGAIDAQLTIPPAAGGVAIACGPARTWSAICATAELSSAMLIV